MAVASSHQNLCVQDPEVLDGHHFFNALTWSVPDKNGVIRACIPAHRFEEFKVSEQLRCGDMGALVPHLVRESQATKRKTAKFVLRSWICAGASRRAKARVQKHGTGQLAAIERQHSVKAEAEACPAEKVAIPRIGKGVKGTAKSSACCAYMLSAKMYTKLHPDKMFIELRNKGRHTVKGEDSPCHGSLQPCSVSEEMRDYCIALLRTGATNEKVFEGEINNECPLI